jgi:DNA-binding response OmpR family regulator
VKKRILLIEDDALVGRAYHSRLEQGGFEVEVAIDGAAGLNAILARSPDAVILDLMLPQINGISLLKKLRAHPAHKSTPVVVFTSNFLPKLILEAQQAGADVCLAKAEAGPIQLIKALRHLLQLSEAKNSQPESSPQESPSLSVEEELWRACRGLTKEIVAAASELLSAESHEIAGKLESLLPKIHAVSSQSVALEAEAIAQLASAQEVLAKQLMENPEEVTVSSLRTLGHSARCLESVFHQTESRAKLKFTNPTALVIDDEIFARKAAQDALEKCHIQVQACEDSAKASQRMQQSDFDIIVSDLSMPGLDGFQLCEQARKSSKHEATPFLLVTALDGFTNRLRSAQTGVDDFIAKPFLSSELGVKALTLMLQKAIRDLRPKFRPFGT